MKFYIDNVVVKSLKREDHLEHLDKTFQILREHKMMLNPAKCIFRIFAAKFMVS